MKVKCFIKDNFSPLFIFSVCLFAFSLSAKLISLFSAPFADIFNQYISSLSRGVFSYITAIVPFSVAETVIICLLPTLVIAIILLFLKMNSTDLPWRLLFDVVSVLLLFISFLCLNFSIAYDCSPLEERLDLDRNISKEELLTATEYTLGELTELCEGDDITFAPDGSSVMPYSFPELTRRLGASYERLAEDEELSFIPTLHTGAKPVALSGLLTYTHISGAYSFFTGEANINVNYPPYVIVFSTAHEMAHQRGIAPEDEASFIAFLACVTSEDEYIRYCGYAQIFEYLSYSLSETDYAGFTDLMQYCPRELLGEYRAYSDMFEKYSDSTVSEVSGAVNDAYLKVNGESEGIRSYDLVTTLAAAYINREISN